MLETLEEMERRVTQRTLYRDNHSVETQANLRRLVELHERLAYCSVISGVWVFLSFQYTKSQSLL